MLGSSNLPPILVLSGLIVLANVLKIRLLVLLGAVRQQSWTCHSCFGTCFPPLLVLSKILDPQSDCINTPGQLAMIAHSVVYLCMK